MGDRNYLHVCRHCGIVHATVSSTGPRRCVVCAALTFSEYAGNGIVLGPMRASSDANAAVPDDRPPREVAVPPRGP